jgi:hypothetical protein
MENEGTFTAYEDQGKKAARLEFESLMQKEREANLIKEKLFNLDIASVRSLREYVAKLPDAPQYLKDYETEVVAERAKLKAIK